MGDLAKILYQQFFLRDVFGKVAPGFIVILALQRLFNLVALIPTGKVEGPWLLVLYVVAIPVCYIIGLGLQIACELVGLHSPAPKPHTILWYRSPSMKEAFNEHRDRLEQINTMIKDKEIRADVKSQRERFVFLKEGSGNFAAALVVLAVSFYIKKPTGMDYSGFFIALLLVAAIILEVSHYLHAARQARFEIRALMRFGLSQQDADKMFDKIPKWTGERP